MDRRFPGLREWLRGWSERAGAVSESVFALWVALMTHDTFQPAELADIDAMARIRAESWGTIPYWQARIRSYMSGELNPQHALPPRILITAKEGTDLIGFVAGHLSHRYNCQGELEWIDVVSDRRRSGVGAELLRRLATWFAQQHASRVCVDVDPANVAARAFYSRHGAESLNAHWLVWADITNLVKLTEPNDNTQNN